MSKNPELESALNKLLDLFKKADEERLNETHENQLEAEKWKSEGDMYGWNFYQGMASGKTSASIIFYRVRREIEKQLSELQTQDQDQDDENSKK